MSYKECFIGIDNGVTGSIGVVFKNNPPMFLPVPTISQQNYTKKKQNVSRIDFLKLHSFFEELLKDIRPENILVGIERPMINPGRWKASMSAIRTLEATLNVLELLKIPYEYIDSKEWQKLLLPKGTKGAPELKKASYDIGMRKFPQFKELIKKQKDADGILIALYLSKNDI